MGGLPKPSFAIGQKSGFKVDLPIPKRLVAMKVTGCEKWGHQLARGTRNAKFLTLPNLHRSEFFSSFHGTNG